MFRSRPLGLTPSGILGVSKLQCAEKCFQTEIHVTF